MELKSIEKTANIEKQPKQLVIFLHGYGANNRDLISLSDEFQSILSEAHFISPNAPFPCEIGFGYQWFSLYDKSESAMFNNMQDAAKILDNFITQQLSRFSLSEENLILIGFSQGTMMAFHVGARRNKPCTIIGYSGMIVEGSRLRHEGRSKPNILLIHGKQDEVIPSIKFEETIEHLKNNNYEIESHLLDSLAHNINYKCLELTRDYLTRASVSKSRKKSS